MKNAVPIEDQLASIEAALPGLDAAGWPILRERLQGLLAQSAGQARWMARVHLALTRLHLFRSAPPEALAHADAALAAACEAGDDERRSRALLLRARAWYAAGDHAHALADVETLLAGEVADQSLRFDALQMLAACSIGLNELDDAWRWQTQAADLAEAAAKPNWRVHCLSNLGGIATLRAEREFQRGAHEACVSHAVIAESFTRRGLAEPSLEHMPPSRLSLLCNLASQLVLQQRFDEAGATFAAADALSVRLSLPVPPLNAAPFKARLLEARGDVAGALSCLEAALARGQALQAEASVLELHAELARLLKAQGRFEPALAHFERFHALTVHSHSLAARQRAQMLAVRLETTRLRGELETERRRAERWQGEALVDALTGLANRRQLEARLADWHEQARLQGRPLPLALLDIDSFKGINDGHSHCVGDATLRRVARLLREHCRGEDIAARWGGDEFVLVLPGVSMSEAQSVCDRLRLSVAGHAWHELVPGLEVTVSVGLADAAALPGLQAAWDAADRALRHSKEAGRDRVSTSAEV